MISEAEFKRIRTGDMVTIQLVGEVTDKTKSWIDVHTIDGLDFCAAREDVTAHTPAAREIEVGHIVLRKDCPIEFTVKGLNDGEAWLHNDKVFDRIVKVSDLIFSREA